MADDHADPRSRDTTTQDAVVSEAQIKALLDTLEVKKAASNVESVMRVARETPDRPGLATVSSYAESRLAAATRDAMNRLGVPATDKNVQVISESLVRKEEADVSDSPKPTTEDRQAVMAAVAGAVASDRRTQEMMHNLEALERVRKTLDTPDSIIPKGGVSPEDLNAIHVEEGIASAYLDLKNPQVFAQVAKELGASTDEQAKAKQLLNEQEAGDLRLQPKPMWLDAEAFVNIVLNAVQEAPSDTVPHPLTPKVPLAPPRMRG